VYCQVRRACGCTAVVYCLLCTLIKEAVRVLPGETSSTMHCAVQGWQSYCQLELRDVYAYCAWLWDSAYE
jgi:hypothetical protein